MGNNTFAKLSVSGLIFAAFVGNVLVSLYHNGVYNPESHELIVSLVFIGVGAAFFIAALRDV